MRVKYILLTSVIVLALAIALGLGLGLNFTREPQETVKMDV